MNEVEKIEKLVDTGLPARKPKMKLSRTAKLGITLLVASLMIGGAYAGILTFFGESHVTMNALQSVVISADGKNWNNYNQPLPEVSLGDVVHCKNYCVKQWIKNQACSDASVSFENICTAAPGNDSAGVTITHYVFGDTQTIGLRQKDTNWKVINEEQMGADLTFNTCGKLFNYSIHYWGLTGDYKLVYYIDQDPRFALWGKVFVIDTITFTGSGWSNGTQDIPTMPYTDDWNIAPPANYIASDGYEHGNGAKFWLVPADNEANGQLITWTPANYLFETDLGLYLDCDNMSPICMPYVYPQFDTTVLKAESTYCWISCYHVDFGIVPGIYSFKTLVHATEIGQI